MVSLAMLVAKDLPAMSPGCGLAICFAAVEAVTKTVYGWTGDFYARVPDPCAVQPMVGRRYCVLASSQKCNSDDGTIVVLV
jgi:hypothetical protein|tara:strand:+ start:10855 stop:11097 length:243 start_codon:yes stop_codon:yes gene_type:complete